MSHCNHCKSPISYNEEDAIWDENGIYSSKIVKCPLCDGYVKLYDSICFNIDNNNDERFYS